MKDFVLGTALPNQPVSIRLDRLLETRMLINASSGAGKSWLLRRLLEQSHGQVQQLVIDPEGEFHTLREKYDYVLVSRYNGDCLADPRSAALLARRLLELGVSAILDIYELNSQERKRFVNLFLSSLIDAPRSLWHPALVVIDEAHVFAPQSGEAESAGAVNDLMTRGRKRGFCGVLATQRLSKLHKDSAAEAHNLLIGRTMLDIDVKRAMDALGFTAGTQKTQLRQLSPGHFFAVGPAITTEEVADVAVGPVVTTHPQPGKRSILETPAPQKIKAVLAQLADLPKEAQDEAKSMAELQARVRTLEAELRRSQKAPVAVAAPQASRQEIKQAREQGFLDGRIALAREVTRTVEVMRRRGSKLIESIGAEAEQLSQLLLTEVVALNAEEAAPKYQAMGAAAEASVARFNAKPVAVPRPAAPRMVPRMGSGPGSSEVSAGERKLLTVLAQYPEGKEVTPLAHLAGYTVNGHVKNMIGHLRSMTFITEGWPVRITDAGLDALGEYRPLPTGEELHRYWYGKLSEGEARMLRNLIEVFPDGLSQAELAARAGYTMNGHFKNMLGHLRTMELAEGSSLIKASESLFQE